MIIAQIIETKPKKLVKAPVWIVQRMTRSIIVSVSKPVRWRDKKMHKEPVTRKSVTTDSVRPVVT